MEKSTNHGVVTVIGYGRNAARPLAALQSKYLIGIATRTCHLDNVQDVLDSSLDDGQSLASL